MKRAKAEAEREFAVYFFDTDAGGVAHNLTYLRWIEAVRTDLAEQLGWGMGEMGAGDSTWREMGWRHTPATEGTHKHTQAHTGTYRETLDRRDEVSAAATAPLLQRRRALLFELIV